MRDEGRGLVDVLDSVLGQDYPRDRLEILVVDGESEDDSVAIAESWAASHPDANVRILDNPGRTAPCAFNVGIRAARGDVVAIFGAHSLYRSNYIREAVAILERSAEDVVCAGGTCTLVAGDDTPLARAIALVLSHPFGRGPAPAAAGDDEEVSTSGVGFPVWRRPVFERIGLYDERLTRNQDNELNARVRDAGLRIVCSGRTGARWRGRATLPALLRWAWDYGSFHIPTRRIRPSAIGLRHLVPGFAVALGAVLVVLAPVVSGAGEILVALVILYGVLAIGSSLQIAATRPGAWGLFPWLPPLFALFHLAYGAGVIRGIFTRLR